jgi:hypothetical protein
MMFDYTRLPSIVLTGFCTAEEASAMDQLLLDGRTRRTDPDTSREAAESVKRMTENRTAVLNLFRQRGEMTDEEFVSTYLLLSKVTVPEQSESGLRTRRSELVKMGWIEDSGETRVNATGRNCIVWRAVQVTA